LQVIGIVSPGFLGVGDRLFDFWAPITLSPDVTAGANIFGPEHPPALEVVGRLQSSANPSAAVAELTGGITDLTASMKDRDRVRSVVLTSRGPTHPSSAT
jgi:hypothetical protein